MSRPAFVLKTLHHYVSRSEHFFRGCPSRPQDTLSREGGEVAWCYHTYVTACVSFLFRIVPFSPRGRHCNRSSAACAEVQRSFNNPRPHAYIREMIYFVRVGGLLDLQSICFAGFSRCVGRPSDLDDNGDMANLALCCPQRPCLIDPSATSRL